MTAPELEPLAEYRRRRDLRAAEIARLDRWALVLANVRLVLFLGAVALVILFWAKRVPSGALWGALACALGFVAAAVAHDRVFGREERARHRKAFCERGLARLEDRWKDLPQRGDRFADPSHPYSRDLDLFGPASLFQLVDNTTSRPGEDVLAGWLLAPAPLGEVAGRQQAVRELASKLDFREELDAEGRSIAKDRPDPSRLIAWAEGPALVGRLARLRPLLLGLPALTAGLYVADHLAWLPPRLWLVPLAVQAVLVLATRGGAGRLHQSISLPGERFLRFEHVFRVLEREQFEAPALTGLQSELRASGAPPSVEMRRLQRAASFLELRQQPLVHIPINVIFLWDLNWAASLESWQRRCGGRIKVWMDSFARFEALASLASFAFDNPAYTYPTLGEDGPRFEGEGLGHPLIPASRRVVNDVSLGEATRALLVSGSNMAGKTTLLRTIGVNVALALAGAPVCAASLSVSRLQMRTSMRVQDSLAQGLSFFYAELRRLKMVVDGAGGGQLLFLLDEVLQGTNTAERHAASRAIIRSLVERGAIGAVATHDLGLATLEPETGGRVRNVHFTDRIVDGEMSFDYRMRPGVVSTTNALALLKKVGIDVQVDASDAQAATH